MDTDLLLTLLRSLLHPTLYSDEALLQALLENDGSVETAAEKLLLGGVGGPSSSSGGSGKKKKRQGTLQGWMEDKKESSSSSTPSSSSSSSTKKLKPNPPSPSPSSSSTSPSTPSSSKPKKPQNLLALAALRPPPPSSTPSTFSSSLPPLLLPSASLLAKHLPCIVVPPSPVPSSLANALYLVLMKESETWEKVTWVINEREVVSPHTSSFYASSVSNPYTAAQLQEAALYWYNGRPTPPPLPFPPLLQQAADLIEPIVNAEIRKRTRFEGEWKGDWRAGVAAVNRYEGSEQGVGPHADQLTYLGPYPTIASLSLGTSRLFRLRAVPSKDPVARESEVPPRTYDIPLANNTLLIMHPPTQERYKHSVPPQKSIDIFRPAYNEDQQPIPKDERKAHKARIGITFRFYRPDFSPTPTPPLPHNGTPRCACDLPCVLKADQKHTVRPPGSNNVVEPEKDPYAFFWMCNKKAGTASGGGVGAEEDKGKLGCGFFRVLDLKGEKRGADEGLE